MTPGAQPLIGWRLWKLHGGRLRSWVIRQDWAAGTNEARCLSETAAAGLFVPPRRGCEHSPGVDCKCGLWALWDFGICIRKARDECQAWDTRDVVVGLMAGWGTVAIHGDEGFRCQFAAVRCLFTDSVADRAPAGADNLARWWDSVARRIRVARPDERRTGGLRTAADHHGVPLLALADAVRLGVLSELGVPGSRVSAVAAELATGR